MLCDVCELAYRCTLSVAIPANNIKLASNATKLSIPVTSESSERTLTRFYHPSTSPLLICPLRRFYAHPRRYLDCQCHTFEAGRHCCSARRSFFTVRPCTGAINKSLIQCDYLSWFFHMILSLRYSAPLLITRNGPRQPNSTHRCTLSHLLPPQRRARLATFRLRMPPRTSVS